MQVFHTQVQIKVYVENLRRQNITIGFIPTMGALHQGHLSLLNASKADNDVSIVSIFVNPLQFNNPLDFQKYPNTLEKDLEILKSNDCDAVFIPDVLEIYPNQPILSIDFGYLNTIMEGEFRPGHFSGVGVVVSKLFHIVQPHVAYFGQKDLQQCAVVKELVKSLNFNIKLCIVPTLREESGLAMSSRNARLSKEGREQAAYIKKILDQLLEALPCERQEFDLLVKKCVEEFPNFQIEYIEACNPDTLIAYKDYVPAQHVAICIALFLEGVRLIDNIVKN